MGTLTAGNTAVTHHQPGTLQSHTTSRVTTVVQYTSRVTTVVQYTSRVQTRTRKVGTEPHMVHDVAVPITPGTQPTRTTTTVHTADSTADVNTA